ncbi:MAG: hypothetical protein ABI824_19790 [Acidobacteriota bacterium]
MRTEDAIELRPTGTEQKRAFLFIFCRFAAALCPLVIFVVSIHAGSVEDLVKELGQSDGSDVQRVQQLAERPALAAKLLISQLHLVKPARVLASEKDRDTEHVLWSIRALRYLTGGKDFCAATSYRFGSSELEVNRKYWLMLDGRTCLPFFAMWPSRGSDYIAPADVQTKIIDQWRKWFAKEGASFVYRPLAGPGQQNWIQ